MPKPRARISPQARARRGAPLPRPPRGGAGRLRPHALGRAARARAAPAPTQTRARLPKPPETPPENRPNRRPNDPQTAVVGNDLFLLGGTVEVATRRSRWTTCGAWTSPSWTAGPSCRWARAARRGNLMSVCVGGGDLRREAQGSIEARASGTGALGRGARPAQSGAAPPAGCSAAGGPPLAPPRPRARRRTQWGRRCSRQRRRQRRPRTTRAAARGRRSEPCCVPRARARARVFQLPLFCLGALPHFIWTHCRRSSTRACGQRPLAVQSVCEGLPGGTAWGVSQRVSRKPHQRITPHRHRRRRLPPRPRRPPAAPVPGDTPRASARRAGARTARPAGVRVGVCVGLRATRFAAAARR